MTFSEAIPQRSETELTRLAELLTALGHPIRLRIVEGLLGGGCCVGPMVECLELPQPLVSRHLGILRRAGVVAVEKQGRQRCYRVIDPRAATVIRSLSLAPLPINS
jgi:DNA-binding transcriptional ArsR family regulator